MKKLLSILFMIVMVTYFVSSCKSSQYVATKSSPQLWGENCTRCHNVPSPRLYTDNQWDVVATHMKLRANLTAEEADKIVEFLKMAN